MPFRSTAAPRYGNRCTVAVRPASGDTSPNAGGASATGPAGPAVIVGGAGAPTSTTIGRPGDGSETFAAASRAVAVYVWLPSATDVSSRDQVPPAVAVARTGTHAAEPPP